MNAISGLAFAGALAMFALARIFYILERRAKLHREPRAVVPLRGAGFVYRCAVCRHSVYELFDDPAEFVDALRNPHHTCARCTLALAELESELTPGGAS